MTFFDFGNPEWVAVPCNEKITNQWLCSRYVMEYYIKETDFTLISASHKIRKYTKAICPQGSFFIYVSCYKIVPTTLKTYLKFSARHICSLHNAKRVLHKYIFAGSYLENHLEVLGIHLPVLYTEIMLVRNLHIEWDEISNRIHHPNATIQHLYFENMNVRVDEEILLMCEHFYEDLDPLEPFCPPGQFMCSDGSCILETHICDADKDCQDGSDETTEHCHCFHNGSVVHNSSYCHNGCRPPQCLCPVMFHQCTSGGCVHYTFVCDGTSQCTDSSDEICPSLLNKTQLPSEVMITKDTFICSNGKHIPLSHKDDIFADCPNGEDEPELKQLLSKKGPKSAKAICKLPDELPCYRGHSRCFPIYYLCLYDLTEDGHLKYCRNGQHLQHCKDAPCTNSHKCLMSYCIPYGRVCDGVTDCLYGEDELECDDYVPPGLLRCKGEVYAVGPTEVCDSKGIRHCPLGDDESLCNIDLCPQGCSCIGYAMACNAALHHIPHFTTALKYMWLYENDITLETNSLLQYHNLIFLSLQKNNISVICKFTKHNEGIFSHQINAQILILSQNLITQVSAGCFRGLKNITTLDLSQNDIGYLENYPFSHMPTLRFLDLSDNNILQLGYGSFLGIYNIYKANISGFQVIDIHKSVLHSFNVRHMLVTDDVRLCCLLQDMEKCSMKSQRDILASCLDLMGSSVLRCHTRVDSCLKCHIVK